MQRWHLTKAVNRQLIEVKQTDEHSAAHGRRCPLEGGSPVDTHDGHVDLNVQRH